MAAACFSLSAHAADPLVVKIGHVADLDDEGIRGVGGQAEAGRGHAAEAESAGGHGVFRNDVGRIVDAAGPPAGIAPSVAVT